MSDSRDTIQSALTQTISIEIEGMEALRDSLGETTIDVVELIAKVEGRLACVGVGKSGHVARKIAATLASTGTQAYFVHPAEASHGDLGMISTKDAVLALSKSGETKELSDIIAYCRRFSVPLIGMTMQADSALGRASDYLLLVPNAQEACGETRAPTTSTTLMIALGDAIAVALIEKRGFTAEDFKNFHPGGSLGAALTSAEEIMHSGNELPLVQTGTRVPEAVAEMSAKGFGCVGVVSADGLLLGIITDGDLRRHLTPELPNKSVDDVMTKNPLTTKTDSLAADVLRLMTAGSRKLTQIFVCAPDGKPVGFIHMHDLLRIGVS